MDPIGINYSLLVQIHQEFTKYGHSRAYLGLVKTRKKIT